MERGISESLNAEKTRMTLFTQMCEGTRKGNDEQSLIGAGLKQKTATEGNTKAVSLVNEHLSTTPSDSLNGDRAELAGLTSLTGSRQR